MPQTSRPGPNGCNIAIDLQRHAARIKIQILEFVLFRTENKESGRAIICNSVGKRDFPVCNPAINDFDRRHRIVGCCRDIFRGGIWRAQIGAEYEGKRVVDVTGKLLVPGFIDTHLHIESSLVTPHEFDRCVGPRGVTTAICDPHEIANVIGVEGIQYFLNSATETVMDIRVNLSSCVPSSHMETAGARIEAEDLVPMMDHPQVIGLAEFMNYPGVVFQDPGCMAKLEAFRGRHIDGHCPQLTGKDLNAYVSAGIRTEHEATTAEEAREKLQKGMRVLIREGSVSKDMHALQELLTDVTSAYMCLCTDDRNPLDIAEHGHLDYMIREMIALGRSPLAVYRAASLSAVEAFGLKDRGQIAPGKRADIVCLRDVADCRAELVLAGGVVMDDAAFAARKVTPPVGRGSVKIGPISADQFRTGGNRTETDVIGILPGKIITEHLKEEIAITDGDKSPRSRWQAIGQKRKHPRF